jgi:glycosyltransferase involved in cell wall biosynthesis
MKIGLFIDTFYPMIDGVVTVVDNYARILSKNNDVIVFAPDTGKYDDSKLPYKVVRCKSIKLPKLDYSLPLPKIDLRFLKSLDKYNLDIIHIHSPFTIGRLGVEYAKKHNIPLFGTIHSQFYKDFYRATRNKFISKELTKNTMDLFSRCDICYTVNEGMRDVVKNEYGFKNNLLLARNATDWKLVDDIDKSKDRIKKMYSINSKYIFLFVGRINKLKNVFLIVDSLNYIKDKCDYTMLFVGDGQDKKDLSLKIKEYDLKDKIILCGKCSDRDLLKDYYASSDLFLFPSLYDASSVVQVEAASQKCPGLFIKGSATSSSIIDNHNGYLSSNDYKEYGNKIIEIVNNKSLLIVRENAYKEIYCTWDSEVNKVYDKYLEVFNKKNSV